MKHSVLAAIKYIYVITIVITVLSLSFSSSERVAAESSKDSIIYLDIDENQVERNAVAKLLTILAFFLILAAGYIPAKYFTVEYYTSMIFFYFIYAFFVSEGEGSVIKTVFYDRNIFLGTHIFTSFASFCLLQARLYFEKKSFRFLGIFLIILIALLYYLY